MKKIIYSFFTLLILAGCNDNIEDEQTVIDPKAYEEIEVFFGDSGLNIHTRSFFEDVAVTEPWESKLYTMRIYVFDQEGKYVGDYGFSSYEINQGRVILHLPREATEQYCSFYLIANGAGYVTSIDYYAGEKAFAEKIYSNENLKNFNGQVEKMLNGELYTTRFFPISGYTKAYIGKYGYLSDVFIPLKRIVAKVAFEWRIDPYFSKNHDGGILVINQVYARLNEKGYTFEGISPRDYSSSTVAHSQVPVAWDGWNHNLWYSFEGNKKTFNQDKEIILSGTYDKDGDLSTTNDQHPVSYTIPIDYLTGQGIINRNTVYRIQATIKGIGTGNVDATWDIKEWDVLPVYDTDKGI